MIYTSLFFSVIQQGLLQKNASSKSILKSSKK